MFFYYTYSAYIAIIGDIKNSQKLKDRSIVQNKLNETLQLINKSYHADITSKFIITLGDEFQGLLCRGANLMHILSDIERLMYPVEIRFGIGMGEITTDINSEMSIGTDGPAYYRARNAVEFLKRKEAKNRTDKADTRFVTDEGNLASQIMINTIFSLLTVIKEAWSSRQREMIWDQLVHQDSQAKTAQRLNISQPAVQKGLSAGNYYTYKEALDTLETALGEIYNSV